MSDVDELFALIDADEQLEAAEHQLGHQLTRRELRQLEQEQRPVPPAVAPGKALAAARKGRLPLTPWLSDPQAVAKRRALPIHAYVGPNGHFKTASMIRDTIPSLLEGRPVLSTVTLLDPATGEPHPNFTRFEHWDQLDDFMFGDLLLDEVVGIANSRESGLPPRIQNILNQLRRRDVCMRWTAPDYARADKIIRETSQGISVCHGYAPDRKAVRATSGEPASRVRSWAPNRLASVLTYDAKDMASWSEGKQARLKPKLREWYWAPGTGVFDWYDTYAPVSLVSYLCPVCGGKPVQKQCRGHE